MEAFARFVVDRRVATFMVVVCAVITALTIALVGQIEQDDDIMKFLPESNEDIRRFNEINRRFGGLDVAMVGLEVPDALDPAFLLTLREVTDELRQTPGVDRALSLANVMDFVEDPLVGGIVQQNLIDHIPTDAADVEAMREKVFSRDHVVGNLIARDGTAVLIYCFATHDAQPRLLANAVRDIVEAGFPDAPKYWGGAPFVSTYIFETTRSDMAALTPWAVLAIVVIMMVSFRDWLGTVLGLFATVFGILVSRGTMAAMGIPDNIVLSSMPIILFAVGSAYSIHMLAHYYENAVGTDTRTAVIKTITLTGPVVLAAGLTTVAGLLSFIMMDIEPMRVFGVFTALGIFVALIMSITFVPAVIVLVDARPKKPGGSTVAAWTYRLAKFAQEQRMFMGVLLLAVGIGAAGLASGVDSSVDQTAFFSKGSPPDLAAEFLDRRFGGSQFLQVHLQGDLEDPDVLREVQRLADLSAQIPFVTRVLSAPMIVATSNQAMSGSKRLPDNSGQVALLLGLLRGDPSVRQLITDDRREALIHISIGSNRAADLRTVQQAVDGLIENVLPTSYIVVNADDPASEAADRGRQRLALRLAALGRSYGASMPQGAENAAAAWLRGASIEPPKSRVEASLKQFLLSEECFVELTEQQADGVSTAVADLGASPSDGDLYSALAAVLEVAEDDMMVDDLVFSLAGPIDDTWKVERGRHGAVRLITDLAWEAPEGGKGERMLDQLGSELMDRDRDLVLMPSDAEDAKDLIWTMSGLPVLYQGLSHSVEQNQLRSMGFALFTVYLIMAGLFRSPISGLLATMPTLLTLAVVYGGMGWLGVHLDIGTSMLASLIIGAGVDYSVHLTASWQSEPYEPLLSPLKAAVYDTAPAIWTNAVMVATGFFVLTLGEARPLQNVGSLTAAAMVTAAVAAFLVIPVLAKKNRYTRSARDVGGLTG